MPKKDSGKGSGDEPIAEFDKYTKDVKRAEAEQQQTDRPHGHPFQPSSAEPILVGPEGDHLHQTTREQREHGTYAFITPGEAYMDPDFNPVAAADVPGHRGGPGAPDGDGSERATPGTEVKERIDGGHDEGADNLKFNWKNPDEQPK